ncbi:MAG: DUF742 domain-containing protein [Actinomycetota bacterium]
MSDEQMPSSAMGPLVRPYAITRGRTRARQTIPLEALVSVDVGGGYHRSTDESREIIQLCADVRSLVEIASLLGVPLGVARVLVGDLAADGVLSVHESAASYSAESSFLERVLRGLRKL